jgi:hypothetical protein
MTKVACIRVSAQEGRMTRKLVQTCRARLPWPAVLRGIGIRQWSSRPCRTITTAEIPVSDLAGDRAALAL